LRNATPLRAVRRSGPDRRASRGERGQDVDPAQLPLDLLSQLLGKYRTVGGHTDGPATGVANFGDGLINADWLGHSPPRVRRLPQRREHEKAEARLEHLLQEDEQQMRIPAGVIDEPIIR
jgi:hypothetical protein